MLPFVYAAPGSLLGVSPWAICVVAGGWTGSFFALRRARQLGYDEALFVSCGAWVVASGVVFGHVLDALFYYPRELAAHPWALVYLLGGQSSCGGFLGAIVGGWLWAHVEVRRALPWPLARRTPPRRLMPFADVLCATFPITWIFGRLGCALVHDHPGRAAPPSWLTVAWPAGPDDGPLHALGPLRYVYGSVSRYDLGLLECAFTIVLAAAMVWSWGRPWPVGSRVVLVCLSYPPVRFGLDFLRIAGAPEADPRYASLTFAQWFCVAMFAGGVVGAARLIRRGHADIA